MPLIQLPPPPSLAGKPAAVADPDVTLRRTDGHTVSGILEELSHERRRVAVNTGKSVVSAPLDKIVLIVFHDAIQLSEAELALLLDTTIQEYTIRLADGSILQGGSYGSVYDDTGLHLFIQGQAGHLYRIILSDAAIEDFVIRRGRLQVKLKPSDVSSRSLDKDLHIVTRQTGPSVSTQAPVLPGDDEPSVDGQRRLAERLGLDFVRLHETQIDPEVTRLVSYEMASRYQCMPLRMQDGRLLVAFTDPADSETVNMIGFVTGRNITPVVTTPEDIHWAINKFYSFLWEDDVIEDLVSASTPEEHAEITEQEAEKLGTSRPIVYLVHKIINDAIQKNASDIHIRPEADNIELLYRIDGTLVTEKILDKVLLPALVSRVKIIGNMNIAERRVPQDGSAKYMSRDQVVDLRISVMPTVNGESVVIRILNSETGLKKLHELGFNPRDHEILLDVLQKSYGMFLVTGPTGSGKSTTLYAALQEIIKRNVNVITIEDPVEYHIRHIEQMQINTRTGYTFARALRNVLRHDPDVIMVGEIRDGETAKIAVESALTGHLVLSTLHTNDAVGAISRLLEIGIEPYLVEATLLAVLAQRLARRNCPHCIAIEPVDPLVRKSLGIPDDEVFYHGTGCEHCNKTGFSGRLAVYELLHVSDAVRQCILEKRSINEIHATALREGMTPLTENALQAARKHLISLAEVYRIRIQ